MKIGINLSADCDILWDNILKINPDYVEIQASGYVNLTDGEFDDFLLKTKKTGIPVNRANGLFAPALKLIGEDATPKKEVADYLEKCFTRGEKFGIKTAVFGSGKARSYSEEFGSERAREQMLAITEFTGDIASKFGVTIVIEPLNSFETNIITSVKEGAEFCRELNHPNVKLLADSYHMLVDGEKFETLKDYADVLAHAHIACGETHNRETRYVPEKSDKYGMKKFTDALIQTEVIDSLTVEAWGWNTAEDPSAVWRDGIEALKNWTEK